MMHLFSWLISLLILFAILGILLYQHLSMRDLELDYINSFDLADRVNMCALPEIVTQGSLCLVHLMAGHWPMVLLTFPITYYNLTLFKKRQHLVEVTEICKQLKWEMNQRIYKIVYLVFLGILSVAWMILSVYHNDDSRITAIEQ